MHISPPPGRTGLAVVFSVLAWASAFIGVRAVAGGLVCLAGVALSRRRERPRTPTAAPVPLSQEAGPAA
ncbi:hypothetical protein SAMN05661080_00553 [Modestobacter sp. DSM 44400]|uniref:hypothetical protein n=1 Tax=Modestobacter sp. DSM 44400 TaxID=1550230 RepID=UPI0008964530|nr:hypothetical protein [Modestobacter sp. DSM 44400]SDX60635.1 hypothetical protein SAMN05661080_00553 [Modestobacter sp. DSM 44400]